MHIKVRLTFNAVKERITEIYYVDDSGKLELLSTWKGWPGIDGNFDTDTDTNTNTKLIG